MTELAEKLQQTPLAPASDGKLTRIEDRLDRGAAGGTVISAQKGGVQFQNMLEVMEFAKLMSLAQSAVPPHLRGNAGACLAIVMQAIEWKMSPFAVAQKSYEVGGRMSYESQLIHAVIEARAPLDGRLRAEYIGEGMNRQCRVIGRLRGEQDPFVFTSDTLAKLKPATNEKGEAKGSPLWHKKPDLQLWYNASRDWARMYCPDVLLGIYSDDEIDEYDFAEPEQPSPNLIQRLPGRVEGAGFNPDNVANGTRDQIEAASVSKAERAQAREAEAATAAQEARTAAPEAEGGQPQAQAEKRTTDDPKPKQGRSRKKPADDDQPSDPETGEVLPPAAPPQPTDPKSYAAFARTWIDGMTDIAGGKARWNEEIPLRNTCGLDEDERMELKEYLNTKVAALRKQEGA